MDDKFIIHIPANAKKEDLHDLKAFMQEEETGFINIFIDLR